MSDTVLRDEIVEVIVETARPVGGRFTAGITAKAILAIPAIKEALAFHESCQKAFEVNGEFTVTKENLASSREGVWK